MWQSCRKRVGPQKTTGSRDERLKLIGAEEGTLRPYRAETTHKRSYPAGLRGLYPVSPISPIFQNPNVVGISFHSPNRSDGSFTVAFSRREVNQITATVPRALGPFY